MKFNKAMASFTAAAVAASAMTAAASANVKVVDENPDKFLTTDTSKWMVMLYKGDGPEVEIDYDLDLTKIAKAKVQFTTDDVDFFDGMFGGAFVMSCGPASITPADHNWIQKNWWGVTDDDAEIYTMDEGSPLHTTKIGDYTYEIEMTVDDTNCFYDNATYCQVALMEWGQDLSQLVVLGMQFYDASGNSMIEFDAKGKPNIANVAGQAADAADDDADADDAAADDEADADADEDDDDTDADDDEAPAPAATTTAAVEEAPAATEAAVTTTAAPVVDNAPAAGDVAAATNSSKGSPDTGVADVAAVAGLAIVAAGAVLVAKKRK